MITYPKKSTRRGSATVAAMLTVVLLLGVTAAMLSMSVGSSKERNAAGARLRAFSAANSAIAHTVANMRSGSEPTSAAVGSVSTTNVVAASVLAKKIALAKKVDDAIHLNNAHYWSNVTQTSDTSYTVTATGTSAGVTQTVEVTVVSTGGGVFSSAVFAGNSDEDPLYTLDFGGTGGQADTITGDVYSGGDLAVSDDAAITGTVRATGIVSGIAGESNIKKAGLDVDSMSYEKTADFQVAALFTEGSSYSSNDAGGSAWQLPEDSPAHIFRKNPDDRSTNINSTVKDDFFLEDPYETPRSDRDQDGSDAYEITFSGDGSEPGDSSNRKVFFVDGNLWIHNRKSYSLKIASATAAGLQITFVVKGNIYMADNLYYEDEAKDAVAFIALKDEAVDDSGNIYFGDPEFGTLQRMSAFMYAENNFYDSNLDESGSESVSLFGNMTAGNQILIDRDHGDSHTKLSIEFDDRITTGDLDMPGLPTVETDGTTGYEIQGWKRVSSN